MDRAQKHAFVKELNEILNDNEVLVVAHYAGLDVAKMSDLRRQVKEAGGSLKVAKNRLTKLALQGTGKEGVADLLTGPTVLAYSSDPVAAPKILSKFSEDNDNLVILGGAFNETVLDANGVKKLASMPSLDELRGKIVGLLQAPATKVAGVVQAPAGQLARVLNAYATQDAA